MADPASLRVAIITISDSVSAGKTEDKSGPAVKARCRELGWEIKSTLVVADDPPSIREQLRELADSGRIDLILTTGGTGLSPRDSTPEATIAVADKMVPGFAEEMRRKGMEKMPRAILSRAVAAIRHKCLILNLPGSPKGAVESLDAVASLLPHSIAIIHGARHD
ncbi:MAG: MogA/MoaB family molybdenum cofactor biosynthesis protein [Acidobacteria bacterium]|nr:MogA/MoaB family molybdenum cofactor biosynthesis protein [Acidobacteriota bacterium]MBS1867499.1 MogA/MoaB family molybdenum cofactor biosynthesis protein [Acidobacteriota bacterium]